MKHRKRKISPIYILCALLLGMFFCLSTPKHSQAQPPPPPTKPEQNPIDGGLLVLAAAGGGYAVKKLKSRHSKR